MTSAIFGGARNNIVTMANSSVAIGHTNHASKVKGVTVHKDPVRRYLGSEC